MSSNSVSMSGSAALDQDAFALKAASEGVFFLDDAQWEAISIHLPVRQRGPKRLDDRIVISGILHVLQSGCAWRDCPREYGPYMTVFNRYLRWTKRGIWPAILEELLHNQTLRKLSFQTRTMQTVKASENRLTSGNSIAARNDSAGRERDRIRSRVTLGDGFEVAERILARTELKALLRTHEDKYREKWIDPLVEWHLRRATLTRIVAAGPDEADMRNIVASGHPGQDIDARLKILIALYNSDYLDAKTRLISALECVNFYAAGGTDGGIAARKMLDILLLNSNRPRQDT